MTEKPLTVEPNVLEDLLNTAYDKTGGDVSYITNIRFWVSNNEITLDLFRVMPDPSGSGKLVAYLIHRVVLPHGLAKNTGETLVRLMEDWERAFGITLPIGPNPVELEAND